MPASTALRAGVVAQLPPKLLTPDPDNPRRAYDPVAIAALADSVKARGVLQPLLVRKGPKGALIVKDGHRRLMAAKQAKLKAVPVLLAAEDDAASLRIDQVAVNNLHEKLAPMDTARMLRKLRDAEKLSANDLAARMAKAGTPMSAKEIEASIVLTGLPDWAQDMIDRRELAPAAAPVILAALRDKPVAKALPGKFRQAAGWDGTVDKRRAEDVVRQETRAHGVDLTTRRAVYATQAEMAKIAHFDWRKVCKGCEHLRAFGDDAYCMSREGFDRHQAEAKEAGLGVGGERPKAARATAGSSDARPPSKREQQRIEAEKAERREKVATTRAEGYLDQWLRGVVAARLIQPEGQLIAASLVLWHAAGRPNDGRVDHAQGGSYRVCQERAAGLATAAGRATELGAFLASSPTSAERAATAVHGLPFMSECEIRELAQALGIVLQSDWRADQPYLLMRTREQLAEWLALYGLDTEGKVAELRQRLLDHPHTLEWTEKLAHMGALRDVYYAPFRDLEVAAYARKVRDGGDLDDDYSDEPDADEQDDDPLHGDGEDTNVEEAA